MKLMLDIDIPEPDKKITYNDPILLAGSCFTGNVGKALQDARFNALHNPSGILFDPLSVAKHLDDFIGERAYNEQDLFYLNELWASWHHHSEFSSVDKDEALRKINAAVRKGAEFLRNSTWLFITFGTVFSYRHTGNNSAVTNCHKAPSSLFEKRMLSVNEIVEVFKPLLEKIHALNPALKIVFTVSPVRHVRDGVIENSRSKARLIEAVHTIAEDHRQCIYFPAYELVLDVLRDYRFFESDMVHPSQTAIQYVFERFCKHYLEPETAALMKEVKSIRSAFSHRPLHPGTQQHKQFISLHLEKVKALQQKLPQLDWSEEIRYFSSKA